MMEEIKIQKEVQIQAPIKLIKDTILDTANYPNFLDSFRKSYVHEFEEGYSDVLFHAKVLMFPIQFRIHTQIEGDSVIRFHQVSGYFEKLFTINNFSTRNTAAKDGFFTHRVPSSC